MSILYNLVITPIELLVEITYSIMYKVLGNCGLAIIAVSLVIQTLILPLYRRADVLQDEEREKQRAMSHWVNHIKKTFKGDEQFMMLSTYYRQQNYKSWYSLKSSFSILLQIPFFIAAYHYLSTLPALSGQSFLFIRDLGTADSIIQIGRLPINILPILMTLFNIISGAIYTRGLRTREKIQVYGLAAIFLVLLYNSPSGLVLYWTMNNLYSMMKNVFMKLIGEKVHLPKMHLKVMQKVIQNGYEHLQVEPLRLYILEALFLTALVGGMISLNVVSASPAEFLTSTYGPIQIVMHNISIFAGIFLVWGTIFAALMKPRMQYILSIIMFALSIISFVNYMGFGTQLGKMSPLLVYDQTPYFSKQQKIVNALIGLFILVVCIWIGLKKSTIEKRILQVMAIGAIVTCIFSGISVNKEVMNITSRQEDGETDDKMIHLSKKGKNVIVFMLDRAINGYVPFIFEEKPEVKEAFDGFTYYPNTLSFGQYTNFAAPAIFGGYEYTPTAMNKRADESLKDKHDEALCVLPRMFSDEGYKVSVCSPPYAGYSWVPDLSIFEGIANVNAYDPCGKYTELAMKDYSSSYIDEQRSNFFYYSLMKICPISIQVHVYQGGSYWGQTKSTIRKDFMDSYTVLTHLIEMTSIEDDDSDNALIMQNSTTHDVTLLKVPEYVPAENISTADYLDNGIIDPHTVVVEGKTMELLNQNQVAHYQANVAALSELAEWFSYIQDNECWDNTRIIVVSDHGNALGQFDYMQLSNGIDVEFFNPLLMVKDFDAENFSVSEEFMTNADVPALAVSELIDLPINPYTGKIISTEEKLDKLWVTTSEKWNTSSNNGNVFDTGDGEWYSVEKQIFDEKNWKKVEEVE